MKARIEATGLKLGLPEVDINKKGRLREDIDSALAAIILFLGIGSLISSVFGLGALPLNKAVPAIVGAILSAFWVVVRKNRKISIVAFAAALSVSVIFVLIMWSRVRDGYLLAVNRILTFLSDETGHIYLLHSISTGENGYAAALLTAALPMTVPASMLCAHVSRTGNRIFVFCAVLAVWIGTVIFKIAEVGLAFLAFLAAVAIMLARALTANNNVKNTQVVLPQTVLIICAVLFCVIFAVSKTGAGDGISGKTSLAYAIEDIVHGARYDKADSGLLDGDLTAAGKVSKSENVTLRVTMENPDQYYFRGFVGETYTGTRWTEKTEYDSEKYADSFYWLHQLGFYGQTQIATLAELVGGDTEKSQITVENIGACGKYVYAPYEIADSGDGLLDEAEMGDADITADGISGEREYTYSVLNNQINNYSDLRTAIYEAQTGAGDDVESYLAEEGSYREYVYDSYLELPLKTKGIIADHLSDYITAGETYTYEESKRIVAAFLADSLTYSETAEPMGSEQDDFVRYCLETSVEGNSVHYATVAAAAFRYLGIPARYVEGYVITEEEAQDAAPGQAIELTAQNAHAWVEIYLDGVGWVPYEITPPYISSETISRDNNSNSNKSDSMSSDSSPDEEENSNDLPDFSGGFPKILAILLWLAAVVILVLIALAIIKYRNKRQRLMRLMASFDKDDKKEAIKNMFAYSVRLLELSGVRMGNGSEKDAEEAISRLYGDEAGEAYKKAYPVNIEAMFSLHEMTDEQRDDVKNLKDIVTEKFGEKVGFFGMIRYRYIKCIIK